MKPRPGHYINITRSSDKQIRAFAHACMDAGATPNEWDKYRLRAFAYFGWDPQYGLHFTDKPNTFGPRATVWTHEPKPETPAKPELPDVGTVCRYKSYTHLSVVACHILAADGSFRAILQHPQGGWDMAKAEDLKPIPRTVTINGHEVPAPETEAPPVGTRYYWPHPGIHKGVMRERWVDCEVDNRILRRGLVHLSEENALKVAEVLFSALMGDE